MSEFTEKYNNWDSTKIIPTDHNNLIIHWDYETDPDNLAERFPVLFYTPHMKDLDDHGCPHHDHIPLTLPQAKKMKDWLDNFLDEVGYENEGKIKQLEEIAKAAKAFADTHNEQTLGEEGEILVKLLASH